MYEFNTKFFSTELPNRAYSNNDAKSIIEKLTTELNPGIEDSTITANDGADNTSTEVINNDTIVYDSTLDQQSNDSSEQQIKIKTYVFPIFSSLGRR